MKTRRCVDYWWSRWRNWMAGAWTTHTDLYTLTDTREVRLGRG